MGKATYIQPDLERWMKTFHFETDIKIRYCETDMSGHVNNVSYLIYFEQGRIDYFDRLDIGDEVLHDKAEFMVVTADITCHYHNELFFRENPTLLVRVARLGNTSMDIEYCLVVKDKNKVAATGSGTIVLVGKETKRSTPIPSQVRERIIKFEQMEMTM
ncbi:acyl-CoA thioester hydrolase [Aneurinibacillus soli]|uniref:Long-chain acyl-CoA thioesterase FadM n=1 Tax=Aneurinibacillus soli TaxID=1500254 RepID=A0A0U5AT28_9BACL|nr:thioesterase family protein [Aneurinibacillus soli]PYE62382.1 acyl-CoA thioester hydrolase [Aneurinibacillus soli]BAU26945.1 Long-chain acyl-CoA thioesterase FadM [Aneurinibacillus soli]